VRGVEEGRQRRNLRRGLWLGGGKKRKRAIRSWTSLKKGGTLRTLCRCMVKGTRGIR